MSTFPLLNEAHEPRLVALPANWKVAVVIPCYRVVPFILDVIGRIGPEVHAIYCVDDACPDDSGEHVRAGCVDPRVVVKTTDSRNQGVGGATMTGYRTALQAGADVIVKLDGDGQMKPEMIRRFLRPIVLGRADYTKGNRFFKIESLRSMPRLRLFGNAGLSFFTKLSSGYWHIMDPTNGYVAIHQRVLGELIEKISARYFFESDLLFRRQICWGPWWKRCPWRPAMNTPRATCASVPSCCPSSGKETFATPSNASSTIIFCAVSASLHLNWFLGSLSLLFGIA